MSALAWQFTQIGFWSFAGFGAIGALCAYGLYRLGPEGD
jgi:hypothetical protein